MRSMVDTLEYTASITSSECFVEALGPAIRSIVGKSARTARGARGSMTEVA